MVWRPDRIASGRHQAPAQIASGRVAVRPGQRLQPPVTLADVLGIEVLQSLPLHTLGDQYCVQCEQIQAVTTPGQLGQTTQ